MAYDIPVLINGKAYEFADILLNILGAPIRGVTSIEYAEVQSMKNIHAAGRYPSARIYGKVEPTASVTLLMSTVEAIQKVAPAGRLQNIPEFDIPIIYVDAANITVKHTLKNCRFMNNNRESSTDSDDAIKIKLDLIISHVEFQ